MDVIGLSSGGKDKNPTSILQKNVLITKVVINQNPYSIRYPGFRGIKRSGILFWTMLAKICIHGRPCCFHPDADVLYQVHRQLTAFVLELCPKYTFKTWNTHNEIMKVEKVQIQAKVLNGSMSTFHAGSASGIGQTTTPLSL